MKGLDEVEDEVGPYVRNAPTLWPSISKALS